MNIYEAVETLELKRWSVSVYKLSQNMLYNKVEYGKVRAHDIIVPYYDYYFAKYYIRNKCVVCSSINTSNYFPISN